MNTKPPTPADAINIWGPIEFWSGKLTVGGGGILSGKRDAEVKCGVGRCRVRHLEWSGKGVVGRGV